ncbi:phospholipase A2-like isoform X2 [Centruroides sculpturatus]|uniref:phospholipase A2-like isoform X1 n=1 Tax=Centruroides sculpturatus TaxID=218467 RepID=UPI000C6EE591|nr:phospholipase A2-like isoform X1 [Centruroides sculpturatus]XP_023234388.1 phospholipase A2-like isoform X2 [Centruroides sculpturatus]
MLRFLLYILILVEISISESQIYVYPYGSKMILVEPNHDPTKTSRNCYFYEDGKIGNSIGENSKDVEEEIIKFLKCESVTTESKIRSKRTINKVLRKLVIFPGTNWCGAGNVSNNARDLGTFEKTDDCCRNHDQCFDVINANQTKYGLYNAGLVTLSHCDCDDEFYECLKEVNSPASFSIGNLFFNVLKMKCFREDYPIKGCIKETGIIKVCQEYEFDVEKPKEWQMFDPKRY